MRPTLTPPGGPGAPCPDPTASTPIDPAPDPIWEHLELLASHVRGVLFTSDGIEDEVRRRGQGIDMEATRRFIREVWARARFAWMRRPELPPVPDEPETIDTPAAERNSLSVLLRWINAALPILDGARSPTPEQGVQPPVLSTAATASTVSATAPPKWIREQFQQQQYKLLNGLWGKEEVLATELTTLLGYTNSTTALDNLRRRVTETNKGLSEKDNAIGEQWEIAQRTRDGALFYYLRRVAK